MHGHSVSLEDTILTKDHPIQWMTCMGQRICEIPQVQCQVMTLLHSMPIAIMKDHIQYYTDQWHRYHTSEILAYTYRGGLSLYTTDGLLYLNCRTTPPTLTSLLSSEVTNIHSMISHPMLPIVLIYDGTTLHACHHTTHYQVTLPLDQMCIHPSGENIACAHRFDLVLYSSALYKGHLVPLQQFTIYKYTHLSFLGVYPITLHMPPLQLSSITVYSDAPVSMAFPFLYDYHAHTDGLQLISDGLIHYISTTTTTPIPIKAFIEAFKRWDHLTPNLDFLKMPLESSIKAILQLAKDTKDTRLQKNYLRICRSCLLYTSPSPRD